MFSTDRLKVETADGRNFVLLEAFSYTSKAGEIIVVPIGTESDGASTPFEIWPTIPPFGKYWKAAFLHDFLYRYTRRPKTDCDALLKEAMIACGVDRLEVDVIYEGVNWCGQICFDQDRKQLSSIPI